MTNSSVAAAVPYRGRFAPSPTGDLHFGSLFAALGSWLRARSRGGAWIVRMEDLDPPREVPGAAGRILETLRAFGLESDEPVLFQSTRTQAYAAALHRLVERGVAFPCRCSRRDLGADGIHRGPCTARPADPERPYAWRVRVPAQELRFDDLLQGPQAQNLADAVGDFVVRRVDGLYAYQLAVVVDDQAQGITEVVRGADLLDSTPRQIWLQRLLGFATPAYLHLPIALDAEGNKLGKQLASTPVDPCDPVPAMRLALAELGIPARALDAASNPRAMLAAALRGYSDALLPRRADFPAPRADGSEPALRLQ